jgi:hypothetical protein
MLEKTISLSFLRFYKLTIVIHIEENTNGQ